VFPDAKDFKFKHIGEEFLDGSTYYTEYTTADLEKNVSFYYAFVNRDGKIELLDDGEEVIIHMQNLLERRKSFSQRLRDFDLLDIIGAIIALPLIFAFIYIVIVSRGNAEGVSKEFLTIVSLILGYYFGRNKA
jgi:hypothetical protein